jgi:putative hemolysin
MTTEIIFLIILLALSSFFSGIETAFMSVSDVKARQLFEDKKKGSKHLKNLKDNSHKLIITLLLGNNVVNIGASAIATKLALDYFGSYGAAISTGVMTFLVLIFGEICPKGIAINNSESIALFSAPIIYFLSKFFFPIVWILDKITKSITNIFSKDKNEEPLVTEEELRAIVMIGEKEGSINYHEKTMINNIFELNDTVIEDVMTPRIDIYALDGNLTISDTIDDFMKMGFSRVPIYEDDPDNVIGFVQINDIFNATYNKKTKSKLKKIKNPLLFVPETKKVDELMREFQKEKKQIAMVVDEFGGISGLVTMEDLLEEIVGEIYDEDDELETPIKKINKTDFIIQGDAEIDDVVRITKIKIHDTENFNTIGGFVLDKLGRIPKIGDELSLGNYVLKVIKMQKRRIMEIKLVKV